jgi:hypothetical protein
MSSCLNTAEARNSEWPRIAVVGAGAVGGYFGGMFARGGAREQTKLATPINMRLGCMQAVAHVGINMRSWLRNCGLQGAKFIVQSGAIFMRAGVFLLLVIAGAAASGGTAKDHVQSSTAEPAHGATVPRSLFFVGVGGGLGIVASGEQSVFNKGISNIFDNGVPLGTGTAEGPPITPDLGAEATGVPLGQLGYFQHFGDSEWLWGLKLSYSYLDSTNLSEHNLVIPQVATGTTLSPTHFQTSFTLNLLIRMNSTLP